jgi:hypothetical protein
MLIRKQEQETRTVSCGSDKSQSICLPEVGPACGSGASNGIGFTNDQKAEMVKYVILY